MILAIVASIIVKKVMNRNDKTVRNLDKIFDKMSPT